MGSSKLFLVLLLVIIMHQLLIKAQMNHQVNRNDLAVAIQEMRRANYFTFVTLINMWSPPLISNTSATSSSITFFMPKDRALSDSNLTTTNTSLAIVSDFLLRHSVPSALLFDHLLRLPTASLLPTSLPNYMLQIHNGGGRSNFFLNNIKLISPNLCTDTSTIRCHGIAAVLPTFQQQQDTTSISCSPSPLSSQSPPPSLHMAPSTYSEIINNAAPAAAPSPSNPPRSAATSTTSKAFVQSCILLCFSIILVRLSQV